MLSFLINIILTLVCAFSLQAMEEGAALKRPAAMLKAFPNDQAEYECSIRERFKDVALMEEADTSKALGEIFRLPVHLTADAINTLYAQMGCDPFANEEWDVIRLQMKN